VLILNRLANHSGYVNLWNRNSLGLRAVWGLFEGCLRAVWGLFEGGLRAVWGRFEGGMRAVWGRFEGCLRVVWGLFEGCLRAVWGLFEGWLSRKVKFGEVFKKIYFYWRMHFQSLYLSVANLCLQTFDRMRFFPPWRKETIKLRYGAAPCTVIQESVTNWQNTCTVLGGICQCSTAQQPLVGQGRLIMESYSQHDLVRKPSTLDALTGYFTPSHVKHRRLLLQFLSAPEDGSK
jgi:hypothetical protein